MACDDPFATKWSENADTVLLHSLARPELNLLSAFDFVSRFPVRVESPSAAGEWDMVIDTEDGQLVFRPPGALGLTDSKARIAELPGQDFLALIEAPKDTTLYLSAVGLPVHLGSTYVIRTRQRTGFYGNVCVYYGKFEPLSADVEAGTVTFQFDVSPVCNSRKLIPDD